MRRRGVGRMHEKAFNRISNGELAKRMRAVVVRPCGELKQVKSNTITRNLRPMSYCYQIVDVDDYIVTSVKPSSSAIPTIMIHKGQDRKEVPEGDIISLLNTIHPIVQRYLFKY